MTRMSSPPSTAGTKMSLLNQFNQLNPWHRWKAVPRPWKVAILFWLWVTPLLAIVGGFGIASLWAVLLGE
jgi:hypothetical protein